jgi:hypothetical protein
MVQSDGVASETRGWLQAIDGPVAVDQEMRRDVDGARAFQLRSFGFDLETIELPMESRSMRR